MGVLYFIAILIIAGFLRHKFPLFWKYWFIIFTTLLILGIIFLLFFDIKNLKIYNIVTIIGLFSNWIVVIFNKCRMPVIGKTNELDNIFYFSADENTWFPFLGDYVSLLGCSIGDILIVSGVLWMTLAK